MISPDIRIRPPTPADAPAMRELAEASGTLDVNSLYAYLLVASLFSETSRVATTPGLDLVGFLAGLRDPRDPERLFVWQIAVASAVKRQGVALALLEAVLGDVGEPPVRYVTATVTPSNRASAALFGALARRRRTAFTRRPFFPAALFAGTRHEAEDLVEIGPFGVSGAREA